MKQSVTVKFIDFWQTFNVNNNKFVSALKTQRDVTVLPTESRETPDILFYSRYGYHHFDYDCKKVYFTGENDFPNFNECDYALSFYETTCSGRNLRYPLYMLYEVDQAINPPQLSDNDALNRGFCSLVMSNSKNCDPQRLEIIDTIESYRPLTYGGAFRNNIGGRVADKIEFIKKYKFNLALENSIMNGYVTEKILEPFAAATIPIYWGDSTAAKDFNPEAYININDYATTASFLETLKRIDNNPQEYLKILRQPTYITDTAQRLDTQLEQFLNDIADAPRRIVQPYGEIATHARINKTIRPLTQHKNFIRGCKILRFILPNKK